MHLEFVAQLYQDQIDGGRYFLHEHPRWATSWSLRCIEKISLQPGVATVQGDQCQYGAETQSSDSVSEKGAPILKPTGFMTNSGQIAAALSRRCQGTGGGRCSRAKGGFIVSAQASTRVRLRNAHPAYAGPCSAESAINSGMTIC